LPQNTKTFQASDFYLDHPWQNKMRIWQHIDKDHFVGQGYPYSSITSVDSISVIAAIDPSGKHAHPKTSQIIINFWH
jgi:hypothetical protein